VSQRSIIAALLVAAVLGHCAAAADAPFFQAFQAPSPTVASPMPGNPYPAGTYGASSYPTTSYPYGAAPPGGDFVGSPLPPMTETDSPVSMPRSPSFRTGVVSSSITDQAAPGQMPPPPGTTLVPQPAVQAVPLNLFDPSTYFASDSSLLMPWDFGPAACNDCRTNGMTIFHNYSSWRGISEGTGSNNNGFSYGFNYGTKLGAFSDLTGIGAQIGGSYGLYDLNGRSSGFRDKEIQQQSFLTVGFFRPADKTTNFSFGVVWDGMFNTNFGQYAVSPFLAQVRAQIAYALNEQHEIGFWAAVRSTNATAEAGGQALAYRAVDQYTLFYHHRFLYGGDGVTWFGIPDHSKLGGTGSLGQYTFGGTLTAPLSPRFGAFTSMQYMAPSSRTGAAAAVEEAFYITLGIAFYPYANSRYKNVAGDCWMPYMPVATDGTFLVDTNHTF
jgi:hypothetical protein